MDGTKTLAAIDSSQQELNTVTDAAVKGKNVNGLRSLILAANSLDTARKHVERAVTQSAPKAKAAKE